MNPTVEDPAKSTYQGVAAASEQDPATVRRASLSAFTPTHEPSPTKKVPNFQLKEDTGDTLDPQDGNPVMTLPRTPVVQRPGSTPNQPQPAASKGSYATLPLTPVVTRPISEPSTPAKSSSGMFNRPPSGMFKQSGSQQIETGNGTMLGLSAVRAPTQASSKMPIVAEQAAEQAPNPFGAETLHGVAQAVRPIDHPEPELELSLEETKIPEERLPEAESTLVGYNKSDLPELSDQDPAAVGTLVGRPAPNLLSAQLRAMDVSPSKPEATVSPDRASNVPVPPGKVVARMDQPPGLTTDVVPMYGEDSVEETRPDLIANAKAANDKLQKSSKEELPTLLAPLSDTKSKKQPASDNLQEKLSASQQAPVESPKPFGASSEKLPAVEEASPLISMNAPIKQGAGTAMLVKAALDAPEIRPEKEVEEPLPGSRMARFVGIAAGVLLLVAALLPVGPTLTPAWEMIQKEQEALLLAVWGAIGLFAIIASAIKLKPGVRGWLFVALTAPALVLGALWGVTFFGELLAPAITEAAKGIAPALKPTAPDTKFLEDLSSLTPPWRVGLFIFGWTLLPAALFYRRFDTASIPARLLVTTGSAVVIANYLIPFEGGFLSALLAPVVGSEAAASEILGKGPVALYSLVLHLLGTGDVIFSFFGAIFALPIVLALLSFTAFFPGEHVSRTIDGSLRITTPVLSTGLSSLWATLFLLYLPVPMVVLGIVLCLDPAQMASGLVFLRFGLVVGMLPLLFSVGFGQGLAARTFRRGV